MNYPKCKACKYFNLDLNKCNIRGFAQSSMFDFGMNCPDYTTQSNNKVRQQRLYYIPNYLYF